MRYNKDKKEIILDRELSNLDKLVIDFCSIIKDYVIVSGYVSILWGRSRSTEDIDLLVPKVDEEKFKRIWEEIYTKGFDCINTSNPKEAFNMLKEHAIRFCLKGKPTPNVEFKIIKNELDKYSYENKVKVIIDRTALFISPIEMQIAYKLFLAADGTEKELQSDKDIEDARHLYNIFKEKINKEEFLILVNKLNVKKKLRLLEWKPQTSKLI